jgi:uncharacterized membrane protein YadS
VAALALGAALSLVFERRFSVGEIVGRYALQIAIVLLGFTLQFDQLWSATEEFAPLVSSYVLATLFVGGVLGALLALGVARAALLSGGTAICGGTAIMSLSPVIGATPRDVTQCLSVVFLLNGIALLVLPWVGEVAGLSQREFGLWVALAVHDTSSVLGTAAAYGDQALALATMVKLGRTLWLIPVVLVGALVAGQRDRTKPRVPLFIVLFVAASIVASWWGPGAEMVQWVKAFSQSLLVTALFFIGMQMTRRTICDLGGRTLGVAVLLWMMVLPATFVAARHWA